MSAKGAVPLKSGFTLVEVVFAVAIIAATMVGVAAIISL
jgi:prepilin-type N-terminal cleavage/methylation domain-containing protein